MTKQTTEPTTESRVTWEHLETWVRTKMREWVQDLLEAEVDELLGRRKSERRPVVDSTPGSRSGYGKPRRLTLCNGTVTLRRPRVRDLTQRFVSRLLPLFARRTQEVNALLPELYLHGLALGDFDLALRGLLGDDAPLSTTTVARLKERWHAEYAQWMRRSLADLQVVYLWVDGVYVKAGLEKDKAAVLVVLAGLSDGRKELVAVVPGHRESTEGWSDMLRDLKARGLQTPKLVVGDGHLGIWAGLRNVFPEAQEQRCWNHKILNALDKVTTKRQAEARLLLTQIPYAPTQQEAEQRKTAYQQWCRQQGLEAAAAVLDRDWERMLTFYAFPKAHWVHLRTSNPVESPFSALRLRTDAARRFKKVDNATAVIWKMLLVAQGRFQRLHAPELLQEVYHGATFVNGVRVMEHEWRVAA
ncbi:MAG: IS256 family transposase [candidate division NC10 bacterium]|nr:IS256 family transposase [candidate division NC10 bacterium]MDE2321650.1 IS256 family transposase [candidate division NC10 bacterium]